MGSGFGYLRYVIVTLALYITMAWSKPIPLKKENPLLGYAATLGDLSYEEGKETPIFSSFHPISFALVLPARQGLHVQVPIATPQDT